jgi:pyruvate-ferredoxin/flavodoxin oxidoreductase
LANIIPIEDALGYLKKSIEKMYGKKGQNIVEMNKAAVDKGIEALVKVSVPDSWGTAEEENKPEKDEPDFIKNIQRRMARHEGDELPVSAFSGMEDGAHPLGTSAYEKRGIAVMLPEWQIDKCIQCGQCSYVCPHATIRPFILDDNEAKNAPDTFKTMKPAGNDLERYHFRIQVSPLDCTGCGNCADICPAKGKALIMKPAEQEIEAEAENWEYATTVKYKPELFDTSTLKGSQFLIPRLEFNGACPGCGETPYIKLLTQLFGDRMMIANATGCSSIWGASSPSIAYSADHEGKGPAWANSLFEDNAEYGYGMYLGVRQIRERLAELMKQALESNISDRVKEALQMWLDSKDDGAGSKAASKAIIDLLEGYDYSNNSFLTEIMQKKDYLAKRSFWILGGDGWAYDIGYGGVDQVLSTGDDVNLFVMDTEIYSNTGGQASKSTPASAVAKFAAAGKKVRKKDLGLMAMSYGYVYVAQIAMGANMNHTIKTIIEAENYRGPSLIIAYAPCISHGIKTGMGTSMLQEKRAVEAGYWQLYRFNPILGEQGKNPFILDSKEPSKPYMEYINSEVRYSSLKTVFPDIADEMFDISESDAKKRYEGYKRMAERR